jgi:hypothetical protein
MIGIKWERNSRALSLAADGIIASEDIIPRTQTARFPAETATVRMSKPQAKVPYVTVHIRGKSIKKKYPYQNATNGQSYECAETCRVNFGGVYDNMMCSNGNLDEEYNWQDVHNVVERVKGALLGNKLDGEFWEHDLNSCGDNPHG